jgi:hypothetical protein
MNPHKFIFCVESRRFLGFIISKDGLIVDLFKFEVVAIVQLSPPCAIHQLQFLQGKINFL